MKAYERYATVAILSLVLVAFLLLYESGGKTTPDPTGRSGGSMWQGEAEISAKGRALHAAGLKNFVSQYEWNRGGAENFNPPSKKSSVYGDCSMSKCFDFSRCRGRPFKVYVYPDNAAGAAKKQSLIFQNVLATIRASRFYTNNPEEACVFVPSLDTIDRDELSKDCDSSVASKMSKLPYWNGGRNHIIFVLFAGESVMCQCKENEILKFQMFFNTSIKEIW